MYDTFLVMLMAKEPIAKDQQTYDQQFWLKKANKWYFLVILKPNKYILKKNGLHQNYKSIRMWFMTKISTLKRNEPLTKNRYTYCQHCQLKLAMNDRFWTTDYRMPTMDSA